MADDARADKPIRALVLAGPTASGKSALALALAQRLNGTVVNADSLQLYADLPLLTARPGAADTQAAPHCLYGLLEPTAQWSAAQWAAAAWREMETARTAGRLPIVVGGTGLYLTALLDGLSPIPDIPPAVRAAARALVDDIGPAALHARLAARDPETAARLRPTDPQRLARAWEVLEATGTPLAVWQAAPPVGPVLRPDAAVIVLAPDRAWLKRRIDDRFEAMLAAGALDQVRAVRDAGVGRDAPVMRALGAHMLWDHLDGRLDLDTAAAQAKTVSRRYAKRQDTWFRTQIGRAHRVRAQDLESMILAVRNYIPESRLTG